MKLSVSLPDDDIDFLDGYAREHGIQSRSAAVQRAIRLLRASQLESAYAAHGRSGPKPVRQTPGCHHRWRLGGAMRRGEVRLANLDPSPGSQTSIRPLARRPASGHPW